MTLRWRARAGLARVPAGGGSRWAASGALPGFIPHFDPLGRPFPLLPPGWTLTYEAVFYVLFAAALMAPERLRAVAITVALGGVVAAGLVLDDPAYILGANPMLLQFAAGLWLAVAMDAGVLPGRPWGFALLFLGLSLFAALQITGFINELWRPLIWGAPATLLVMGALCLESAAACRAWRRRWPWATPPTRSTLCTCRRPR